MAGNMLSLMKLLLLKIFLEVFRICFLSNQEAHKSWHAEHKLVKNNCTKKLGLKEHLVEHHIKRHCKTIR